MLEIKNVSKIYGEGPGQVVALDSVSLSVADGDFVAIVGPSGSGKSTLLNVIGGLERVSKGEVMLDGSRIDHLSENDLVEMRRRKVAYIFQQYHLIPYLSAWENVFLPVTLRGSPVADRDRAAQLLREVGLEKRARHKPLQLSGGEQQRVAIARALVNGCPLILADEPTGNVDRRTGTDILDLFQRLNATGQTIVIVTHSPEIARQSRRTVTMVDGRVVSENGRT
jgi:putative ABC transport system ATP-binding protein